MFEVTWTGPALAQLAKAWAGSDDRNGMTEAVRRIDDQLTRDPLHAGESREKRRRILIEPPLAVRFDVDRTSRRVVIAACWTFRVKGLGG